MEHGSWWEQAEKIMRACIQRPLEILRSVEDVDRYREAFRFDYYGTLSDLQRSVLGINLNYCSIPNPTFRVSSRAHGIPLKPNYEGYDLSAEQKEALLREAREKAAALIGLRDPSGVVLCGNTTQAMSMFHWLSGYCHMKNRTSLLATVLTTDSENPATYRTIGWMGEEGNPYARDQITTYSNWTNPTVGHVTRSQVNVTQFGCVQVYGKTDEEILSGLEKSIRPSFSKSGVPDVLLLSHVLRDTGRALPVEEIIRKARALKAVADPKHPELFVVLDGAQALGNIPHINFHELGADYYVASPHKTMGSEALGLGFFDPSNPRIQREIPVINSLNPLSEQKIFQGMFDPRIGVVPNTHAEIGYQDLAGFLESVDELHEEGWLQGNDFSRLHAHRLELKNYLYRSLTDWGSRDGTDIQIPDISDPTSFIASFRIGDDPGNDTNYHPLRGHDPRKGDCIETRIAERLNDYCIALSFIRRGKLFRLSFHTETTKEDIDRFVEIFADIVEHASALPLRSKRR